MLTTQQIEDRFGFHKATIEGAEATKPKHEQLRMDYKSFANMLNEVLPDGREKSLAMTALEEASMWSHKAIAQSAPLEVSEVSITQMRRSNFDKIALDSQTLRSEIVFDFTEDYSIDLIASRNLIAESSVLSILKEEGLIK